MPFCFHESKFSLNGNKEDVHFYEKKWKMKIVFNTCFSVSPLERQHAPWAPSSLPHPLWERVYIQHQATTAFSQICEHLCFILIGCHHQGAQHTCISRRSSAVQGSEWPLHVWTLRRWAVLEDWRKWEFCSLFALPRKSIIKLLLKNRYFASYFNFKLCILCTRLKFHF